MAMKVLKQPLSALFAKARVKGYRQLMRLILGPLVGRMPFTSIRSLEEVVYRKQIKNHIVAIVKIQVLELFEALSLVQFCIVTDDRVFHQDVWTARTGKPELCLGDVLVNKDYKR